MSLVYNKNFNFDGYSQIKDENDKTITLATFNASYYNGAQITISKNISNIDLYIENLNIVDADFAEFEENILSTVKEKTTEE